MQSKPLFYVPQYVAPNWYVLASSPSGPPRHLLCRTLAGLRAQVRALRAAGYVPWPYRYAPGRFGVVPGFSCR